MSGTEQLTKLDADKISSSLIFYCLYTAKSEIAIPEYSVCGSYIADVFAIKYNHETVEYEIKVTEQDLKSELKSIEHVLTEGRSGVAGNKYYKHKIHIEQWKKYQSQTCIERREDGNIKSMPSRYFFVVPDYLLDMTIAGVQGSPYGVILATPNNLEVKVKSKILHDRAMSYRELHRLVHTLGSQVIWMRRELNEMWERQRKESST